MPKKIRLLDYCTSIWPEKTRDQCYALILAGKVVVNKNVQRLSSFLINTTDSVELIETGFVSRGGDKLEAALKKWNPEIQGKIFLDAGASTGGFTDCLLKHGAAKVHCVDVGYNQLDYSLRKDPRVIVHEKTGIQVVKALDPVPDAAVADLSFRSLRGIIPHILNLTAEKWMIALIKPQFEWLLPDHDFDGIVSDEGTLQSILVELKRDLEQEGIAIHDLFPSPVKGRKGNQEYLAYVEFKADPATSGSAVCRS